MQSFRSHHQGQCRAQTDRMQASNSDAPRASWSDSGLLARLPPPDTVLLGFTRQPGAPVVSSLCSYVLTGLSLGVLRLQPAGWAGQGLIRTSLRLASPKAGWSCLLSQALAQQLATQDRPNTNTL